MSVLFIHHQGNFLLQDLNVASSFGRLEEIQRPKPDNMQRVRDLETLSPKQNVSIKFLPSRLWRSGGRRGGKCIGARGDGGPRKHSF